MTLRSQQSPSPSSAVPLPVTFPQVQGFRLCVGDGIRREQWVDGEGRWLVTRHERAGVFGIEAALGICQEWFRLYGERCLMEPVFVDS